MKRDTAREIAIQIVFGAAKSNESYDEFLDKYLSEEHYQSLSEECELYSEFPDEGQLKYIVTVVNGVDEHFTEINAMIEKYSHGWGINRISETALAVLRVCIYEIFWFDSIPIGSAINSAVEIGKAYDEESTVSFINGVLGGIVRGELSAETDCVCQ